MPKSDQRKQGLSIRLDNADIDKIKRIAARLQVRDADVIRYAIRSTLGKLQPLHDQRNAGYSVLPVFIEHGAELASAFNLDAGKLDRIINADMNDGSGEPRPVVTPGDLELLTMSGNVDGYLKIRLREIVDGDDNVRDLSTHLKDYIYRKYIKQDADA